MSQIPLDSTGKRPRFFAEKGGDETVSMMLELMAEFWTMRERLYALERVAEQAGLPLTQGIEEWQPSPDEAAELDQDRKRMIQTVLRSLEANHVPGLHLRRSLDVEADGDVDGEHRTNVVRAA